MNSKSLLLTAIIIATITYFQTSLGAEFDAQIQFAHRITMSLPVSGQVDVVAVKPGQNFQAGDTLLALDMVPFNSAVIQAQAEVTKRTTENREAERDYGQLKELYDRGVISAVELENGQLKYEQAKAALEAAQAHLTQAKYNLAHAAIIAPFNGWVLNVSVNKNETVNNQLQTQPLLVLAESNKYIARFQVPLSTVQKHTIGNPGAVSIGNKTFKGVISAIALEPSSEKKDRQLYVIDIEFDSKGILLRPGQAAKIIL